MVVLPAGGVLMKCIFCYVFEISFSSGSVVVNFQRDLETEFM
jgi:hypothetical protein